MKLKEYLETRKISKNIFKVIALVLFMTIFNSLSYAYFTSTIEGEGKEIVLSTSDISIKFEDNEAIKKTGLTPGESIIKKFSVTNNSEGKVEYKINWEYLINNFVNREYLTYSITSTNGGGTLTEVQLPDSEEHINIISSVTINPGVTQEYTMTINYKNSSSINQDADKNKSLIGKLEITDMSGNSILPETSTGSSESPIESEQNLYGLKLKDIRDFLYPVGSIYTSTESTNPSEKFGGVWERYGKVQMPASRGCFATRESMLVQRLNPYWLTPETARWCMLRPLMGSTRAWTAASRGALRTKAWITACCALLITIMMLRTRSSHSM